MKLLLGTILTIIILTVQVGEVFAAPVSQEAPPISGTVQGITLESDPTTGVITVVVDVLGLDQSVQEVRLTQETATTLGLVLLDEDGNPVINKKALVKTVKIDPAAVIPAKQEHPVGNALATFFSTIEGIDYATIMSAHEGGAGFGVIAQALWLTSELEGDSQLFQDLLYAKQHNDFTAFGDFTDDGTPPKNWGQLRKVLLEKKSLGIVMSNHNNNGEPGNGSQGNPASGNPNANKDKNKDKNNNGNGNNNGGGNGHNK